jgi:hypothetical protein
MKLSRIVCLMLFLLCLSVSLSTMLSIEFAIAYGVAAMIASFVFMWKTTLKCPLLRGECCLNLLYGISKTFTSVSVYLFIVSVVYALVLVFANKADLGYIFERVFYFSFVLCMPFFFMVVESSLIIAIKDTKSYSKMLWIFKKSLQYLRRFFVNILLNTWHIYI